MSSTTSAPRSYPFAIANAFTQDVFGGNPATIIFLNPSDTLTQEERLKFAKGFNQPMVVFLTLTSTSVNKQEVVSFGIQYFTSSHEIDICGHGTIAAMKVVLDSAKETPGFGRGSQFPAFSSPETHTVEFTTAKGVAISARKVIIEEEDWLEIVLPAGKVKDLPAEEEKRVLGVLAQAMKKEPGVKYIGAGEPPFQDYLLIVLEESENLERLKLDIKALVGKTQTHSSRSPIVMTLGYFGTEGDRLPSPRRHYRFHKWEISRRLHHEDVRPRGQSRRGPRLRFSKLHDGPLLGDPEGCYGTEGQTGQRERRETEGGDRWGQHKSTWAGEGDQRWTALPIERRPERDLGI